LAVRVQCNSEVDQKFDLNGITLTVVLKINIRLINELKSD
jgi:hypothetical protein